jgi:hypothetical protein
MAQPVIGLTLDHEPPGGYSKFPWYAIRENYCNAVRHAGGLPILLPHDPTRLTLSRSIAGLSSPAAASCRSCTVRRNDPPLSVTTKDRHRFRIRCNQGRSGQSNAGARDLRRPAALECRARRHLDPAHPDEVRIVWRTASRTRERPEPSA